MSLAFLFHYFMLNMFRMLVHPRWALNIEIIKQVTSSWSIVIQLTKKKNISARFLNLLFLYFYVGYPTDFVRLRCVNVMLFVFVCRWYSIIYAVVGLFRIKMFKGSCTPLTFFPLLLQWGSVLPGPKKRFCDFFWWIIISLFYALLCVSPKQIQYKQVVKSCRSKINSNLNFGGETWGRESTWETKA